MSSDMKSVLDLNVQLVEYIVTTEESGSGGKSQTTINRGRQD